MYNFKFLYIYTYIFICTFFKCTSLTGIWEVLAGICVFSDFFRFFFVFSRFFPTE
ncbi:hypothetical protein Hanom_Chr10g00903241 [Helianthus anomalus]